MTEREYDIMTESGQYVVRAISYEIIQKGLWNPSEPILNLIGYGGDVVASFTKWRYIKRGLN